MSLYSLSELNYPEKSHVYGIGLLVSVVMTLAVAVRSITAGKKLAALASGDAGVRYGSNRVSLKPAEPRSGGRRRQRGGRSVSSARELDVDSRTYPVTSPAQNALSREVQRAECAFPSRRRHRVRFSVRARLPKDGLVCQANIRTFQIKLSQSSNTAMISSPSISPVSVKRNELYK